MNGLEANEQVDQASLDRLVSDQDIEPDPERMNVSGYSIIHPWFTHQRERRMKCLQRLDLD